LVGGNAKEWLPDLFLMVAYYEKFWYHKLDLLENI